MVVLRSTGWHDTGSNPSLLKGRQHSSSTASGALFSSCGPYNIWAKMPWPFSESIKKRACRYLLHRYLGNFLEEKLSLDQLSLDLYQGTGSLSQVPLDKWVCAVSSLKIQFISFEFNRLSFHCGEISHFLFCFSVTERTTGNGRRPVWSHYWVYPDNFSDCPMGSSSARKLCPSGQRVGDGVQTKTQGR